MAQDDYDYGYGGYGGPPARPSRVRQASGAHFSSSAPQGRRPARRPSPYADDAAAMGYYTPSDQEFANAQRRRRSPAPFIAIAVVLLAAIGAGLWFFVIHPSSFEVSVNGQRVKVNRGDTVATLLDEGYATPAPGNLLAIDGSVIVEGGGTANTITLNGQEAAPGAELTRGANVQIGDGIDVTEEATVTEDPLPYEMINFDMGFESYWAGSIHLLLKGQDGVLTTRTGVTSGISLSEETTPPRSGGYRVYTAQTGGDPVVALTFDDGPWPDSTAQILDILGEYGARATFFTIGNQVADHADDVRRASEMGCEVCTHTWDHASGSGQGVNLTYMSPDEQVSEVTRGFQAIADVLGAEPSRIMRAPGGNFYGSLISTLWDYVDAEIGWDVDTEDWSRPGVQAIVDAMLSVQPGQVILMHDGGGDRSQTVEALREALPVLVERGYQFVTVSELIAYGLPE